MESKNSVSPDSRSPEQLRQPKEEPCELPESSIPTDYEAFKQQQWEQEKKKRTNMCMEQWSNYQSFPTQRWEGERVEPQLVGNGKKSLNDKNNNFEVPQPTTQPTYFLDSNFGNPLNDLKGCLTSVYQPLLASNPRANEFDPRYPFGQYLYCPPSRSDAETSTVSVTAESSNQYLCFHENPTDEEFEKLVIKLFNCHTSVVFSSESLQLTTVRSRQRSIPGSQPSVETSENVQPIHGETLQEERRNNRRGLQKLF
ncbi:hypothetical protein CRE_06304 [Caenorhabditis remanei]|uniref:Uncharacterized protein n=1 Tax=Caenorhabditis remanei TaxID=31234 RepID=E3M163_CAERE|nr:hypothetical protein CRE_06304 [Caenorhabditis remanei]